jgi:hypothetical protein
MFRRSLNPSESPVAEDLSSLSSSEKSFTKWSTPETTRGVDSDRRGSVRYAARNVRVSVCWQPDEIQESCLGTLVDISMGGALLEVDGNPPLDGHMWIRLEQDQHSEWVEVKCLSTLPKTNDKLVLRVAFQDGCPYSLFRTVVWGNSPLGSADEEPESRR